MKLKKWIVPVCAISLFFTGCMKTNDNTGFNQQQQNQLDDQKIQDYLSANSIAAQKDTLFDRYYDTAYLYYIIDSVGRDTTVTTVSDTAIINVTGQLLDGTIFYRTRDSANATRLDTIYLSANNNLLTGALQYGITLLKPGGSCTIYSPSVYGYGPYGFPSIIPSNAPLIYSIKLVDVKYGVH